MLTKVANTKVVSVIIYDLNETGGRGAILVLGITLLPITFAVAACREPLAGARPRAAPRIG